MDKDKTPDEKAPLDAMGRAIEDEDTRTDVERELERVESIEAGISTPLAIDDDDDNEGSREVIDEDLDTIDDDEEFAVEPAIELVEPTKPTKNTEPVKKEAPKADAKDVTIEVKKPSDDTKKKQEDKPVKDDVSKKAMPSTDADQSLVKKIRAEISGKKSEAHKSSSVALVLATLFIVLLIAAVAWLVYQKMDTEQKLTAVRNDLAASEQARMSVQNASSSVVKESTEDNKNNQPQGNTSSYRMIPEWGVRYMADPDDADITTSLNIDRNGEEVLTLQSISLARTRMSQNPAVAYYPCATLVASAGTIARLSQEEYAKLTVDTANAEAAEWKSKAKKVGEHYYLAREPSEQCVPTLPEFANEQKKLEALTKKILELPGKFEPVSQSQQTKKPSGN